MARQLKTKRPTERANHDREAVRATVEEILEAVRVDGDAAVRRYSKKFDDWDPVSMRLSPEGVEELISTVPESTIDDIRVVQANVRSFAERQLESLQEFEIETEPGVLLGQRLIPVQASAAYVPGGRYPLTASAHMTIVTAKVASVPRVAASTPPIRGSIPAATVAAMHMAGADEIYVLGGVQAIAALAMGTETIAQVNLLTGPGNAYVAEAKKQLFGQVGIDLFAGPTEILIVADHSADPMTVAVDLLSQAEHGPDSPSVLICTDEQVARESLRLVEKLLPGLATRDLAGVAWRDYGEVYVVDDLTEAYELADAYAFEHVEVLTENPRDALTAMRNYGALFLGERTCVSYGDKVIGTNHVLPTMGASRYTGGLWVGKYLKTVTYQEITSDSSSAALGELCGRAARVELFEGHARAGDLRSARFGSATFDWLAKAQ
jgi:sulfopropanediol 3-dehydrogenase